MKTVRLTGSAAKKGKRRARERGEVSTRRAGATQTGFHLVVFSGTSCMSSHLRERRLEDCAREERLRPERGQRGKNCDRVSGWYIGTRLRPRGNARKKKSGGSREMQSRGTSPARYTNSGRRRRKRESISSRGMQARAVRTPRGKITEKRREDEKARRDNRDVPPGTSRPGRA